MKRGTGQGWPTGTKKTKLCSKLASYTYGTNNKNGTKKGQIEKSIPFYGTTG